MQKLITIGMPAFSFCPPPKKSSVRRSVKGEFAMDTVALILMVIGALNWGLVGIFQFDLVAAIFGGMSGVVSRIIYTVVGLAGIWGITMLFRRRNRAGIMSERGE